MAIGNYKRPYFLFNKHLETIYPALFRRVRLKQPRRERITTPDEDFLDLDWFERQSKKLVIISHGLEGNSSRAYIKGMAKIFYDHGYDVLAWNYRGCGDEMNKTLRFYHSGATDDLDVVVKHAAKKYDSIFLIGFSLGGNITLKYLAETREKIRGAVAFSVPLNLRSSCEKISRPGNIIYSKRFLKSLKKKIVDKAKLMPGINIGGIGKINDLKTFDDRYTAPLHGFKDAVHYYESCSALYFLKDIRVPTLVVNAKNDPFLSEDCYPTDVNNGFVEFDYSQHGGHVGFAAFGQNGLYWSELRALQFIEAIQ